MAYAREHDDLRRELRKGQGGTFVYWPKVDGENVEATAATATVYDPSGSAIETPTPVISGNQVSIPVSAIDELDEDYRVEVGFTFDSVDYFDVFFFDVVLFPWGQPSISLNDILEERPDAKYTLERQGRRLGLTSGSEAEEMAGIYAVRARVELDSLVRDQVARDAGERGNGSYLGSNLTSAGRYTRPYLILNRERLNRVERKLALKLMYAGEMTAPDSAEEAASLYAFYDDAANNAWRGVGPLKYDDAPDMVPDADLGDIGRVAILRRVQG